MPHLARHLLTLGYLTLTTFASGHGAEFLQAKLAFDPDDSVRLELTADYGDNPMIGSQAEAQAALDGLLQIEIDHHWHPLTDLAPLHTEQRTQLDLSSPLDYAPDANKAEHQLLVATWHWAPTQSELRFQVPRSSKHDVLFWKAQATPASAEPRVWKLLIANDTTPIITVPQRDVTVMRIAVEISGLIVIALVLRAMWKMDWSP
jgi:hypothetical protein